MNPDEMIQKYLDTSCVKCGFLTCGNKSFYLFGKLYNMAVAKMWQIRLSRKEASYKRQQAGMLRNTNLIRTGGLRVPHFYFRYGNKAANAFSARRRFSSLSSSIIAKTLSSGL